MSPLNIVDATAIPWQNVLNLLGKSVQKYSDQRGLCIEESKVLVDILDHCQVIHFFNKLKHGGLIHDVHELFDQLEFVLDKVRVIC